METLNGTEEGYGSSIYIENKNKKLQGPSVLLAALAPAGRGRRVLSFRRRRETSLPLRHEVGGGTLQLGRGQLGDSGPGDAFGHAGIGGGRTRVPFAKAGNGASAHNEVVIDKIRKSRNVPGTRSWTAILCSGRLVMLRGLYCRPARRGRMLHLRRGKRRIPHIPVVGRIILRGWTAGVVICLLGLVRAPWGRCGDGVVGGTAMSACRRLRW